MPPSSRGGGFTTQRVEPRRAGHPGTRARSQPPGRPGFGCHTWALNAGKAQATHHVVLHAYESLSVRNGDFADHALVQTAGPAEAQLSSLATGTSSNGMLRHSSDTVTVTFQAPGIDKFITVESPHRLLGPFGPTDDYVLTLTVHVLPGQIE